MRLPRPFARLLRQTRGATATEYAVLIGCVALICVAVLEGIGSGLAKVYAFILAHLG